MTSESNSFEAREESQPENTKRQIDNNIEDLPTREWEEASSELLPSISETEDEERFQETAKFEEEVKPKLSIRRRTGQKKGTAPESESISRLQRDLKNYSNAKKKTDASIKHIQRELKELNKKTEAKYRKIYNDIQSFEKQVDKRVSRIENLLKSTKSNEKKKKILVRKLKKKTRR